MGKILLWLNFAPIQQNLHIFLDIFFNLIIYQDKRECCWWYLWKFFCCREFYYIQMEKYARQAVSEGVKNSDDIHVSADSEIYRVLNLHYNRNNHIEVWGPQVRALARTIIQSVPAHERFFYLFFLFWYF